MLSYALKCAKSAGSSRQQCTWATKVHNHLHVYSCSNYFQLQTKNFLKFFIFLKIVYLWKPVSLRKGLQHS